MTDDPKVWTDAEYSCVLGMAEARFSEGVEAAIEVVTRASADNLSRISKDKYMGDEEYDHHMTRHYECERLISLLTDILP